MEATGYSRWFDRLLAELGFELWIGDPAEIQTKRVKKQKTDGDYGFDKVRCMMRRLWIKRLSDDGKEV
jgi:hypothetical protein